MTSIWWIRRDLRLHDQPTLHAASANGDVLPLFILDPFLLNKTPARRQTFLFEGLRRLAADLMKRGATLVIRRGNPGEVLTQLLAETNATAVYAEEDYTPYARRRDREIARAVDLRLIHGQSVFHPRAVCKADGTPYVVFAAYARSWRSLLPEHLPLLPAPVKIDMPPGIASDPLPELPPLNGFPAGEAEGQARLTRFCESHIGSYADQRDRMALEGTSTLSPYLRFGMLSLRTAVAAAIEAGQLATSAFARQSAEKWLSELTWREFYIQVMFHFPHVKTGAFQKQLSSIHWRNDRTEFQAWKEGCTGVPVVDAAMRQLKQTGWMHNRARMIAASYLVKELLIDWRWGERWFMDNLIDGDPAANNGGWQWTAGTGTDAVPYFRIFNPVLQGRKFDPHGEYVRRWVPELALLPDKLIHAPWEQGVVVPGYPAHPLVDHKQAIERTRRAYETAKRYYSSMESHE